MTELQVTTHVGRDLLQSAQHFKTDHAVVWEYVSNSLDNTGDAKPPQVVITIDESGYALDSRRPHTLWSATAATAPSRGHRAAVVGPIAAAHCAPRGDSSG